jgi:hypothetical protein
MNDSTLAPQDYHLPEGLWLAWYSRSFYRAVARWRVKSFAYLFILVAAALVPDAVRMRAGLQRAFESLRASVAGQIPTIKIAGGHVETPEARPYLIPLGNGNRMAVDTTGKISSLAEGDLVALLTRDRLYVRASSTQTRTYDLSKVQPLIIDQSRIDQWIRWAEHWLPILLTPILLAGVYLGRLLEAALLTLLGTVVSQWLPAPVRGMTLLSLAIAALTPALVVEAAFDAGGMRFTGQTWLSMSLTLGYFFFALHSAADPSRPESQSFE